MGLLSDCGEFIVVAQSPARRWTYFTDKGQACYVFDLLGALSGWAMLLGRKAGGAGAHKNNWHIIARKGQ